MAMNNPYATYKQTSIETKSKGELTLMLYDGCIKFIKRAEIAIHNKNLEEKNTNLIKAQNIIRELMVTLQGDSSLVGNMMQLYDFILTKLIKANTDNDVEALAHAEELVKEFRDTWKEVVKIDRQNRHGNGVQGRQQGNQPSFSQQ
ncbi:flagellar export chaperone FliS [Bacillus sp. A301a_S52]|nr:flagellar export chaperone FliS [Bacillus sp. A301a_S52]